MKVLDVASTWVSWCCVCSSLRLRTWELRLRLSTAPRPAAWEYWSGPESFVWTLDVQTFYFYFIQVRACSYTVSSFIPGFYCTVPPAFSTCCLSKTGTNLYTLQQQTRSPLSPHPTFKNESKKTTTCVINPTEKKTSHNQLAVKSLPYLQVGRTEQ